MVQFNGFISLTRAKDLRVMPFFSRVVFCCYFFLLLYYFVRIFLHMELNRELSANFIQKLIEISALLFFGEVREIFWFLCVQMQNTLHYYIYIYILRSGDRSIEKKERQGVLDALHTVSVFICIYFLLLCSMLCAVLCCPVWLLSFVLLYEIDRGTWKHFRYIVKLTCTCCEPYDMIENKLLESKSST